MFRSLRAPLTAVAFSFLVLPTTNVSAQEPLPLTRPQFGVGYVANAPSSMAGGSAYVLFPKWGGVGLYVDAKFDVSTPADERGYEPDLTGAQVAAQVTGASFVRTEDAWYSVNAAVMKVLSPYFTFYAGGGLARATPYQLYNVPLESSAGVGGVVWAEDPDQARTEVNLMVGMLTRLTPRVTAQFGYETKPDGVTAGVSLRIPRW